jgi:hypothetical protein
MPFPFPPDSDAQTRRSLVPRDHLDHQNSNVCASSRHTTYFALLSSAHAQSQSPRVGLAGPIQHGVSRPSRAERAVPSLLRVLVLFVPCLRHGSQSHRTVNVEEWIHQSLRHHFKRIEDACKRAPAGCEAKESDVLLWTGAQRQSGSVGKMNQPA